MKVALITTPTIGDGLLMMIAAFHFKESGYEVTIYNSSIHELKEWFAPYHYQAYPPKDQLEQEFSSFDLIFTIYRKDSILYSLLHSRDQFNLTIGFFSNKSRHLSSQDILLDKNQSMATNIAAAIGKILGGKISKENGIKPVKHLQYRKSIDRIILHPTSNTKTKNWDKIRYLKLANKLKKRNFHPVFCVGPKEIFAWDFIKELGFDLLSFSTLHELASFIYQSGYVIGNDSGLVHLASNLNIPSITLASNPRKMQLWRADWLSTKLLCPSKYIPNIKGFRLRDRFWSSLISYKRILQALGNWQSFEQ